MRIDTSKAHLAKARTDIVYEVWLKADDNLLVEIIAQKYVGAPHDR